MPKKKKNNKKKKKPNKPKPSPKEEKKEEEETVNVEKAATNDISNENSPKSTSTEEKAASAKKRKRKKKKKKLQPRGINLIPVPEYCAFGQTYPPSKRMHEIYTDLIYPVNETMPHPNGEWRMESKEEQEKEQQLAWTDRMTAVREAAEIHRQVRQDAQRMVQPGMDLTDICNYLEGCNRRLLGFNKETPLARCWGFPTGCSLNECAAHYTPNPGDKVILKKTDLMKIDFGVQINGYIIDCAWTMSFDPMHDTIMKAVKDATNTGIKNMGIDARLGDVGAAIQEAMESYSCNYDGKEYPVKCVENLSGHSIGRYKIHAENTVPIVKSDDNTRMKEGEMYAIETFGTTGNGWVEDRGECSHFMRDWDVDRVTLRDTKAKKLLGFISKRFDTLAFCRRWLAEEYDPKHLMALKRLCDSGVIREYPPLCDIPGCYTAQYEHTIVLRPTCKEVVSRGKDY